MQVGSYNHSLNFISSSTPDDQRVTHVADHHINDAPLLPIPQSMPIPRQEPQISLPAGSHGPLGANLFVFHLPTDWTESLLRACFDKFGRVVTCRIQRERTSQRSRGFGFVCFEHPRQAWVAMCLMHNVPVPGTPRCLRVQVKREEDIFMSRTLNINSEPRGPASNLPIPSPELAHLGIPNTFIKSLERLPAQPETVFSHMHANALQKNRERLERSRRDQLILQQHQQLQQQQQHMQHLLLQQVQLRPNNGVFNDSGNINELQIIQQQQLPSISSSGLPSNRTPFIPSQFNQLNNSSIRNMHQPQLLYNYQQQHSSMLPMQTDLLPTSSVVYNQSDFNNNPITTSTNVHMDNISHLQQEQKIDNSWPTGANCASASFYDIHDNNFGNNSNIVMDDQIHSPQQSALVGYPHHLPDSNQAATISNNNNLNNKNNIHLHRHYSTRTAMDHQLPNAAGNNKLIINTSNIDNINSTIQNNNMKIIGTSFPPPTAIAKQENSSSSNKTNTNINTNTNTNANSNYNYSNKINSNISNNHSTNVKNKPHSYIKNSISPRTTPYPCLYPSLTCVMDSSSVGLKNKLDILVNQNNDVNSGLINLNHATAARFMHTSSLSSSTLPGNNDTTATLNSQPFSSLTTQQQQQCHLNGRSLNYQANHSSSSPYNSSISDMDSPPVFSFDAKLNCNNDRNDDQADEGALSNIYSTNSNCITPSIQKMNNNEVNNVIMTSNWQQTHWNDDNSFIKKNIYPQYDSLDNLNTSTLSSSSMKFNNSVIENSKNVYDFNSQSTNLNYEQNIINNEINNNNNVQVQKRENNFVAEPTSKGYLIDYTSDQNISNEVTGTPIIESARVRSIGQKTDHSNHLSTSTCYPITNQQFHHPQSNLIHSTISSSFAEYPPPIYHLNNSSMNLSINHSNNNILHTNFDNENSSSESFKSESKASSITTETVNTFNKMPNNNSNFNLSNVITSAITDSVSQLSAPCYSLHLSQKKHLLPHQLYNAQINKK